MQDVIPDLWPDEITRTEVPTPLAILRIQANNLRAKTKGIIEAEVRCLVDREKKREIYHFEIVAPALEGQTIRLFSAEHAEALVYPIEFDWPEFENYHDGSASTPEQVYRILKRIFQSEKTTSIVMSLMARSNEKRTPSP